MSERLADLRRQRALVAEQLAWLDQEIAAAAGSAPAAVSPAPVAPAVPAVAAPVAPPLPPARVPVPPPIAAPPAALAEADEMLEKYRVEPGALKSNVTKGCFLYFFAALALVALAVVGLYFFFQRGK